VVDDWSFAVVDGRIVSVCQLSEGECEEPGQRYGTICRGVSELPQGTAMLERYFLSLCLIQYRCQGMSLGHIVLEYASQKSIENLTIEIYTLRPVGD
jgi:hypothetical protein